MIEEHDVVVLAGDHPEHGLRRGDVGAVVHRYGDAGAVEVEFVTGAGRTVAVLTLGLDEVRAMRGGEILHARLMATGG